MALLFALMALSARPAFAQQHSARLSADLAEHLRTGGQDVDVIVDGSAQEVSALARKYNLVVKRRMKSGAVLRVNTGQLDALRQDEAVDHLSSDERVRAMADFTAESIGADQVWAGAGALRRTTGKGIVVAVVDSGIDTTHAALRNRVIATMDFIGGNGEDHFGHGTHVASLIAGRDRPIDAPGAFRGIGFGARLVNLRALGDDGLGDASVVVEAIDWAIEHREALGIRIINLSLGAPVRQPFADDPMCAAVERAVRAGILVVAAAGNTGLNEEGQTVIGGITSPGNSPFALTVGATDTHDTAERSDDTTAPFSARGPTAFDMLMKPDLAAPGTNVLGAEAAGALLMQGSAAGTHVRGHGAHAYMELSGTSMAAAVVSGAAALLMEERPDLGLLELGTTLLESSTFLPDGGLAAAGAGSVNVLAAASAVQQQFRQSFRIATMAGGTTTARRITIGSTLAERQSLLGIFSSARTLF